MNEFQKFKRRLKQHPGVPVAALMTLLFTLAGYPGIPNMIAGGIASTLLWIVVLITAWNDRNIV